MVATVQIDKTGRLVLPKKMRDALHLVSGTRIVIEQRENSIVLRPETKPRGLHMKEGVWVYDVGPLNALDAINSVHDAREARSQQLLEGGFAK